MRVSSFGFRFHDGAGAGSDVRVRCYLETLRLMLVESDASKDDPELRHRSENMQLASIGR